MRRKSIEAWGISTTNALKNAGKHKGKEKNKYYNSCLSVIKQVINLRKYDLYTCHYGKDDDGSHLAFITILEELEEKVSKSIPAGYESKNKESKNQQNKIRNKILKNMIRNNEGSCAGWSALDDKGSP